MPLQELIGYFESLPDEKLREYEVSLTSKANTMLSVQGQESLLHIIDSQQSDRVRYNAFYCLNIVYRHNKDFAKLHDLIERHRGDFEGHVTFDHLDALYNIESDAMYDYNELLQKTSKNARLINDNAGFVHMFADTFSTIYETGGLHDKGKYVAEWGEQALAAVNRAIELDSKYAKYYCTKARILCILGEFSQATMNVNHAISCENSARGDYALRISTYQYYKMLIHTETRLFETVQSLSSAPALRAMATPLQPAEAAAPSGEGPSFVLTNYEEGKPYLFISYSHKDQQLVYHIMELLQQRGVRLWCDVCSIPTGTDYFEYIAERIDNATVFMPMLSLNAIASEFVRKEMIEADHQSGKLTKFPVFLEELMLSPGLRMMLGGCQRIHWFQNTPEQNIEMMLRDLPPEVFIQ